MAKTGTCDGLYAAANGDYDVEVIILNILTSWVWERPATAPCGEAD